MRVLVTGATGFVGGRLVPAIVDAGHEVVALVRDPDRYDPPDGVEVATGDLLDPDLTLPSADAAYYLVHSMESGGDFEERDRRCARNFATAATAAGVERVVYLGGLGADRDDLSDHLRSRREVEFVLADGDYDLTVLRAAVIVGAGSASFSVVRQLVEHLPVMVTPSWVRTPCQPIAISDVVAYLTCVLSHPETAGDTYEIGGPDVLTYESMLRTTARVTDNTLHLLPVPVLSPRLSAYWLSLVTDVSPSVARPLVEGLKNPVVCDENRLLDICDVTPTSFEDAVRAALAEAA
ncbi:NAD(P)H-binding protein [Salarchaeum japonicum]|uniref:NAD(P)H-binding protein n=1 Tax=Salarchaeum japonicum TaxID=555573 RepID=UPI003C7594C5